MSEAKVIHLPGIQKPKLLDQVRNEIRTRHYSNRTEEAYVHWILLFLYREILGVELEWLDSVVRARKPARLPVVLTKEEVVRVLSKLHGPKWLVVMLLYGAGLRVLECLRLRIKDLDLGYRQITIREGKGNKDRMTVLPNSIEHKSQRKS